MTLTIQHITPKAKTSVLEQTLNTYNSLEYLFHFLSLNEGYGVLDTINVGETITIDNYQLVYPIIITQEKTVNPYQTVIFENNQTCFDICLRNYGNLSNILNIIQGNPKIDNINNQNLIGLELSLIPNNNDINVKFYNKYNIKLTTGYSTPKAVVLKRAFNRSFSIAFH